VRACSNDAKASSQARGSPDCESAQALKGRKFAEKYGVDYIDTSAKNDMNVNKAFELLAIKILEGIK
jgi:hypothetical protein